MIVTSKVSQQKGQVDPEDLFQRLEHIEEISNKYELKLESCTINIHRTPLSFDLDFMLMTPNWLIQHLETYRSKQYEDIYLIRERIMEKVRQSIKEIYSDIPVVTIIVSRI
ncbi:unnamed protein product [Rotaria sp. Silwood1]|nr:unnamed protein product [Rotaria sp. Silwood1]